MRGRDVLPRDRHDFLVGWAGAENLRADRDNAPVSHPFEGNRVDPGDMMGAPVHAINDQAHLFAQFVREMTVKNPPLHHVA